MHTHHRNASDAGRKEPGRLQGLSFRFRTHVWRMVHGPRL